MSESSKNDGGSTTRRGIMGRVTSMRGSSTSRSRSRSSSRQRDGRPSYRFLMTIQRISGLPSNWTAAKLQHPGDEDPIQLTLTDGVAHVHRGIAFERSFRRSIDRQADSKFRLLNEQGKKFAKVHIDLEQLRQEIDLRDNIIAKIVTLNDDLNLGGVKMEFKLGYFAIDTQTSHSVPVPLENDEPIVFDEVSVTLGVGPLGASFANTLIPPTVIRLVPLPDGSASPLKDKVTARSELIKFNDKDSTLWTLDDFKDNLIETKSDKERVMVFNVPRLSEEDLRMLTTPAPVTSPTPEKTQDDAKDENGSEEEAPAAEANGEDGKDATTDAETTDADAETAKEEDSNGDGATAAAAAGVAALAVGAGAAAAMSGDNDEDAEDANAGEKAPADEPSADGEDENKNEDTASNEKAAEETAAAADAANGGGWDTSYLNNVGFTPSNASKEPSATPLEFSVSVPNYVINSEHQYVLYDVNSQGLKGKETQTFRVLRRYNNFVSLKAKLELELDGAALPDLPSKWTYNALFKRFESVLVEDRRESLEQWLQTVYSACIDALPNSDTLVDFLTAVPEHNHVLSFESKEKVEVVVKGGGAVRLYGNGFDQPTPRNVNTNGQVS